MSAIGEAKTQCPCGYDLRITMKKPGYFSPPVSKISCPKCDSRFLMYVEVKKHKKSSPKLGTVFVREYTSRFEIIRLSASAKKRASSPIGQTFSTIIEKVSKRDNGPEFED